MDIENERNIFGGIYEEKNTYHPYWWNDFHE